MRTYTYLPILSHYIVVNYKLNILTFYDTSQKDKNCSVMFMNVGHGAVLRKY
jgi:hypothetical protein